jgi:predicted DNA-binding transcriptional regulator AlpA
MESLLTKKDIAQRYKVCTSTIDKWMRKRTIPFIRISCRCVRFDAQACDRAIVGRPLL